MSIRDSFKELGENKKALRIIWFVLLMVGLISAAFLLPFASTPEIARIPILVVANICIIAAIVMDVVKIRPLVETEKQQAYKDKKSKANRAKQKQERAEARQTKKEPTVLEQLEDPNLSYLEKVKLRARLSAQVAQQDPHANNK